MYLPTTFHVFRDQYLCQRYIEVCATGGICLFRCLTLKCFIDKLVGGLNEVDVIEFMKHIENNFYLDLIIKIVRCQENIQHPFPRKLYLLRSKRVCMKWTDFILRSAPNQISPPGAFFSNHQHQDD